MLAWVQNQQLEGMAKMLHCSKSKAHENFNCGLAILQSRLLLPS
jgi:hypothetical protein